MTDDRPSWDEWAIGIASAVAERADCRRMKVGAVILNAVHRVVSTGYNGVTPGRDGCLNGKCPRGRRTKEEIPDLEPSYDIPGPTFCIATHAEMNALIQADPVQIKGGTLYCTLRPCSSCYKIISNTELSRVVYVKDGLVIVDVI
jgi:dCMP deaminase